MELLSRRQLQTIASIGTVESEIHYGPYGCGKTYCITIGVGYKAKKSAPPPGDGCILVVGKTAQAAKSNICNPWAAKFGKHFRYDKSKKDGYEKDAVLYGHRVRIVGLNDANAEARVRGINAYLIIGDEVSTWSKDNFLKVIGRLRGEAPEGWVLSFIGATNPDSPVHYLKQMMDAGEGGIRWVKWTAEDNITTGAEAYYRNLRKMYEGQPAYYARYVLGEWAAAEGLVYGCFKRKTHTLTREQAEQVEYSRYDVGIDFGLNNPTSIVLAGQDKTGTRVVLEEEYLKSTTLSEIGTKLVVLLQKYPVKKIYVDPSATALKDKLRELRIHNFEDADNSVKEGIQRVYDCFTEETLFIVDDLVNLIAELYTYAYKGNGSDDVIKANDHACDALRYLISGSRTKK